MTSNLPLPVPPRTPTPPSDNENPIGLGLGLDSASQSTPAKAAFDPKALSPMQENFPAQYATVSDKLGVPQASPALGSAGSLYGWGSIDGSGAEGRSRSETPETSPFSFQTMSLSKSPVVRSNVGQRRGHKYKHSSVSHQIFLEPPPRAPLALPASLPIPNFSECKRSMSTEQQTRTLWSCCHALIAAYTWWSAQGSLALTALSHLVLFDALGASLCVVVDVLGNFEVWKRSSIRHPFGLERVEVLAGFAMSVFLLFMGMDLISHNLQHILESKGHEPHHVHNHQRVSPGGIDFAALVAIMSTLVSAIGLKNHARIGKAMRFAYIESLPFVLSNPSHFLTLSCSGLLLLLPLLSVEMYVWLDRLLSGTMAVSMCILGVRLVKNLAFMLLMSYSGGGVPDVIREIESDAAVSAVDEARFWQVHYGLCMANLKLRVQGSEETLTKLRERITSLVRNQLGGGYGSGGTRWEVSTEMIRDRTD